MTTQNGLNVSLSGQSGTGNFAGTLSPTFISPTLGNAVATSINKIAFTAPASSAIVTIADLKTLTNSNILTFTGTDSSTITFGAGGTAAFNSGFTAWTPIVSVNGSVGDLSIVYVTQIGNYVKIGNLVVVNYNVIFTPTFTTSTGSFLVANFPFTSNNATSNVAVGMFYISTADTWPINRPNISSQMPSNGTRTVFTLSGTAVNATNFTVTQFVSGTQVSLIGTVTYIV